MQARQLLLGLTLGLSLVVQACASSSQTQSGEPQYNIVRPPEGESVTSGVPPDKENEIKLLLQQRDSAARKCYQDVLNEKHDRSFAGTIQVMITIEPSGRASAVKVVGGTLNDNAVQECLVETIKDFEFPQLAQAGDVQFMYQFRPAY
jgi:hypothetical protein